MVKIALCGFAAAFLLQTPVRDAHAFSRKGQPAPAASVTNEASAPAAESVWVSRPDGSESCAPGSGQALEDGAADLRKAKVRVLESRKGDDGKAHIQMCGAPAGRTNAYLIPREDLPQAVAKGFVAQK